MFNPADFDALTALVEKRYAQLSDNHHMKHERSEVLWCIHVAHQTAKEYGMMADHPNNGYPFCPAPGCNRSQEPGLDFCAAHYELDADDMPNIFEPAPVRLCQDERLTALLDQWEKRIEDLNKEFDIAKAAGRWQHVIQLEAYAVELIARRNEIRDMLKQSAVRLCQECGAAPVNSAYSRLCEACYAIACEEIRAELAQEQPAACSNCGAAPELPYATLCQECYARFIGEIEERHKKAAIVAKEPIEEEPQEYILIEPGQEPSGNEPLHNMHPDSAKALSYLLKETGDKRRWLPSAEILGSAAIVDASDDALEPFA